VWDVDGEKNSEILEKFGRENEKRKEETKKGDEYTKNSRTESVSDLDLFKEEKEEEEEKTDGEKREGDLGVSMSTQTPSSHKNSTPHTFFHVEQQRRNKY